jgi:hypothetical protein
MLAGEGYQRLGVPLGRLSLPATHVEVGGMKVK